MAVGDETIGFGGVLEVNDGVADAFQVVPKVESLGVPNYTIGTVDSKRLDLTNGVIIVLPTLSKGDAISFKIQHTNETYGRFVAIRDARVAKQWRITVPDDDGDTEITVPGILTGCPMDPLEADKITTFTATVQISGEAV